MSATPVGTRSVSNLRALLPSVNFSVRLIWLTSRGDLGLLEPAGKCDVIIVLLPKNAAIRG